MSGQLEGVGRTPSVPPASTRFFTDAGLRLGWELRDIYEFCRPFPYPAPIAPSAPRPFPARIADWLRRRADYGRDAPPTLPLRIASSALVAWLVATALDLPFIATFILVLVAVLVLRPGVALMLGVARLLDGQAQRMAGSVHQHHATQMQHWQQAKARHDAAERARVEQQYAWYGVVRPEELPNRLNVCGGLRGGWQALVTTLGSSLLAGGRTVLILDLSQREVPAGLAAAATDAGVAIDEIVLPRDEARFNPFMGWEADEVAELLADALATQEADGGRAARSRDMRPLRAVCRVLAPDLRPARVAAGLYTVMGERTSSSDNVLTPEEFSQLYEEFSDKYRDNMYDRLDRLAADLEELRGLGTDPQPSTPARLRFVSLSSRGGTINELYQEVLVQLQLRQLRTSASSRQQPVTIIAGADKLQDRHLEELGRLTSDSDAVLICLFEHFAERAQAAAGQTGSALAFMRLQHPEQADSAAAFIGNEEVFKLSQRGKSHGQTDTQTWSHGESRSWSFSENEAERGPLRHSYTETVGRSSESGGSRSQSHETSSNENLVVRHLVEPRDLRAAADTDLYLVQWGGGGRVRGRAAVDADKQHVRYADCDPLIALDPRAAQEPFALSDGRRVGG